jgi:hypothetical protein
VSVLSPTRKMLVCGGMALVAVTTVAAAAAVAHAAGPGHSERPGLLVAGGILPSPTSADGYLVNMTVAPRSGELTGPVIVVACNRRTCHTATGGGSLPIVNVPFSLGHRAAGARVTVDVAVCSRGFRCGRMQASGVVPPPSG